MYKTKTHHECEMPARAKLNVLALNGSLKREPDISNTDEVTREVIANMGKSCEINSEVIRLAHKYFKIERFSSLVIHHNDAFLFVKTCQEKFDLIIVDVFVGAVTPPHLEDEIFLEQINCLLLPTGMVLYNRAFFDSNSKKSTVLMADKMGKIIGQTTIHKVRAYGIKNAILVCEKE